MCHNPAFGYAGPLGLCLGVETTIEANRRQVTVVVLCVSLCLCTFTHVTFPSDLVYWFFEAFKDP